MPSFLHTAAFVAAPLKVSGCCGCLYQSDMDFLNRGVQAAASAEVAAKSALRIAKTSHIKHANEQISRSEISAKSATEIGKDVISQQNA